MAETYLIGIAGPSGAGKSYLAQHLSAALNAPVLSLDAYYRDLSHLPVADRALSNFDHPAAVEHELLIEHARQLSQGRAIEKPCYDFATHTRITQVDPFGPAKVVIFEGLFTLYWPELRKFLGTTVYVEMGEGACLERRLMRDVRERGRSMESVRQQFFTTVAPMAELYVKPGRTLADIVVAGDALVELAVSRVLKSVRRRSAHGAIA
jgi:uridine kinase